MTTPRLLFDECLGKPHIETLKSLVALEDEEARPIIEHLLNLQDQGVWDEVWIPRVAHENWILISGDKSRRNKKGEPLRRVCVRHGITHVLLSPTVSKRRTFEKMLTMLSLWYQLTNLPNAPRGSRFMIEPVSMDEIDKGKGKLVRKDVEDILPPSPPGTLPFPPLPPT